VCGGIIDGLKPGLDEIQGTNLTLEEMPELAQVSWLPQI